MAETIAVLTGFQVLQSTELLVTGVYPDTGLPASNLAIVFAVVDVLPQGKWITRPLKSAGASAFRRAAVRTWDALSKMPRGDDHVHHRIPLEWAHLFPEMNPNRLSNLKLLPTEIHNGPGGVSAIWSAFRNANRGRTPSPQEVLDKAAEIDARFGEYFIDLE